MNSNDLFPPAGQDINASAMNASYGAYYSGGGGGWYYDGLGVATNTTSGSWTGGASFINGLIGGEIRYAPAGDPPQYGDGDGGFGGGGGSAFHPGGGGGGYKGGTGGDGNYGSSVAPGGGGHSFINTGLAWSASLVLNSSYIGVRTGDHLDWTINDPKWGHDRQYVNASYQMQHGKVTVTYISTGLPTYNASGILTAIGEDSIDWSAENPAQPQSIKKYKPLTLTINITDDYGELTSETLTLNNETYQISHGASLVFNNLLSNKPYFLTPSNNLSGNLLTTITNDPLFSTYAVQGVTDLGSLSYPNSAKILTNLAPPRIILNDNATITITLES